MSYREARDRQRYCIVSRLARSLTGFRETSEHSGNFANFRSEFGCTRASSYRISHRRSRTFDENLEFLHQTAEIPLCSFKTVYYYQISLLFAIVRPVTQDVKYKSVGFGVNCMSNSNTSSLSKQACW